MYRGLIHFHSEYSYDSLLKISDIVDFAIKQKLNFLALTDHETIKGSLALKKYVQQNNFPIEIILGAEYNTEFGDVIALGITKEIKDMKFDNFLQEVKRQNGILLFPHPYKNHKNIKKISKEVDLIEVFNARTDDLNNNKALHLAKKTKLPIYFATDAHNYSSLGNAIIEFEKKGDIVNSLKNSEINILEKKKSKKYEICYSQLIKVYKKKDIKLLFILFLRIFKNLVNLKLFRNI